MALIGKIRKNFWFVLILLGFALAAFILMDMTGSSGPGAGAGQTTLGSVAGQKIDYQDFQRTEQAYYSGGGTDQFTKKQAVWDFYVENALIQEESKALGLSISNDELMDLQFGANPSPIIQQVQFQPAQLQDIKTKIENREELVPVELKNFWKEQENQIIKSSLQTKLNNIITKSIFTPEWMAAESFSQENSKADFNYVKIPYDQIDAAGLEVSDADISNYMASKKAEFEVNEETRILEYATFNVSPTAEDTAAILVKMDTLLSQFAQTSDDSIFVIQNGGAMSHLYASYDLMPAAARDAIANLQPGEMFGPYIESDYYLISKLLDKKVLPDTVEVSHILRSANPADPQSFVIAESFIDSIQRVYNSGRESYDSLAIKFSQDTRTGLNGGELGNLVQENCPPEFSSVCFLNGDERGVYKIKTQIGVHLVKVGKKIFNNRDLKYRVASVSQPIIPSQETQDTKNDLVTELISANRDMPAFREALANHPDVTIQSTAAFKTNDYTLGTLGSGQAPRDMVKWAFNGSTEVGDVSDDVYRFTDPVKYYDNKYVAVSLKEIIPQGLPSTASARSQVESLVMNKKKGEKLKSSIDIQSLEGVASQYGVEVQNAADVSMTNTFIPGMGNEPEVVGLAFKMQPSTISQAIVGNSGVYVIQPLSTQPAPAANNIPMLRTSVATSTKSQVGFKIIDNLKKRAKITDQRTKFF